MHCFALVSALRTVDHQVAHGLLCILWLKQTQGKAIGILMDFCTDDIVWWWVLDKA